MPDTPVPPRVRRTQAERAAESSQRLLRAAIELFAEQGYERTSTEQIAARAGYSRSMVSARYGSKRGLLEAVTGPEWEQRLVTAASTPGATGRDRIAAVVDTVRHLATSDPVALRAFLVVSFEAAGPNTELRSLVNARLRLIETAFAQALAAGVQDGSIRPDIDPVVEARELVHNALGAMYRWIIDPDGFDYPAYLNATQDRTALWIES